MRKSLKKLVLISVFALSSLSLVACDKDKEKDNDGKEKIEELFNIGDVSTTTEETTEVLTTVEVTTEATTTEATTTEATTEEEKEVAPYVVTDMVDTSSIVGNGVEGSDTNPAKQGEWCEVLKTQGTDKPKAPLYFRVTGVKRGEEAMSIIREYEANDGFYKFDDLGYDDLEYCVMDYQVYFPEDYPEESWGVSFTSLSFHIVDGDNAGLINNYIGMTQTYDISPRIKNNTAYAGDVVTRQMVFVMVKDYSDYMVYHRYYDDDSNIYTKYIACEQMAEGWTGTESPANTPNSTETPEASSTTQAPASTETSVSSSKCTITNGVYYVVGVTDTETGRYATKEQLEQSSGSTFEIVFTVVEGMFIFDGSKVGEEGIGIAKGDLVQTSDTEFYFTDASGNTFNGTWDSENKKITITMGSTILHFE